MKAVRIVAADDEPLALDRLSDLLAQIEGAELVATAQNGKEVIEFISELRPDLVLLDIEMPRLDGFDVVEVLLKREWSQHDLVPLICFVTAYPQFASEAFDTGALDFLCKPIRLARLEKTLRRARVALARQQAVRRLEELSSQLEQLRRARVPQKDTSIWVQQRGEIVRLPLAMLEWIEAEGEYVRLHAGDVSYLLRSSLTSTCDELADAGVVRVHRSFAINGERLQSIRRSRSGMTAVLYSGRELPVGRKFRKAVEDQISIGSRNS